MTTINLLPGHWTVARQRRRERRLYAIVVASLLALGAGWWMAIHTQVRQLTADLSAVRQGLAAEQQRSNSLAATAAERRRLTSLAAIRGEAETPFPTTALVALLCQLLPDSVALDHLSIEMPPLQWASANRSQPVGAEAQKTPAAKARVRVSIQGIAMDDLEVARLVSVLSHHRLLSNVTLVRSQQAVVARESRCAFEITLDVAVANPSATTASGKKANHES